MSWCFALVNNKLAEIYFEKKGVWGHCFVRRSEFKTKKELKWIDGDTKKFKYKFIEGKYVLERYRCLVDKVESNMLH